MNLEITAFSSWEKMDSIITISILLNPRDHHSLTTHSVDFKNKWQSYMLSNTSWQHTKAIEQVINDQISPSNLTWFTLFKNPILAVYHANLLVTGWNPNWVVDHDNSNMSWTTASLRFPQANCLEWTCNKQGISSF